MTPPDKPTVPQWMIDAASEIDQRLYLDITGEDDLSAYTVSPSVKLYADMIQSHHAASQRWIPCAEGFPETFKLVAFRLSSGSAAWGYPIQRGIGWRDVESGTFYELDWITHWQPAPPLPQPPTT
jgi:hypothetical protein